MSLGIGIPLEVEANNSAATRESVSILFGLRGSLSQFGIDDYPLSSRGASQRGLFIGI